MPKEVIESPFAGAENQPKRRVHVGWSKDLPSMQVATLGLDDRTDPRGPEDGWYVDLDREGVNRLIRTLRKARDAAFGSDA